MCDELQERLWSYLSDFATITKEMRGENRVDLLVEGLLHYGNRINTDMRKRVLL
jgi:hypothetical protein